MNFFSPLSSMGRCLSEFSCLYLSAERALSQIAFVQNVANKFFVSSLFLSLTLHQIQYVQNDLYAMH